MAKATQVYDESSIRVLEGLDPIKLRPDMYTDVENPTHLIGEMVDNAADEAIAGYADSIEVTLYRDGSLAVEDTGRGIPAGIHPTKKIHTFNVLLQTIHSGGKFSNTDENASYKQSGGLHGVGISLTNALSNKLELRVKRGGEIHHAVFENGETVVEPQVIGKCPKNQTGTLIRSWPNPKYFTSPHINKAALINSLKSKAIFIPSTKIIFNLETDSGFDTIEWAYKNGPLQYFNEEIIKDAEIIGQPLHFDKTLPDQSDFNHPGDGFEAVFAWSISPGNGASFCNLILNKMGGTHESGFRDALFAVIRDFADSHSMNHKNVKLTAEDVWTNLNFIINARMASPAFKGQTKDKLNSPNAIRLVAACIKDQFSIWFNNNVQIATEITKLAIGNAIARSKTEKPVERRKTSGVSLLPGKLTDAEVIGPGSELYLVEGESAGGSAKQARNKGNQGILALKGKSLNTWEEDSATILSNSEVNNIATSIGIDPHGRHDKIDLTQLRYGKIILLMDADFDGLHIQSLIMTLFMAHFPQLLLNNHVYIAHPPLYIVSVQAHGKMPFRQLYAADNTELKAMTDSLTDQKVSKDKIHVSYLKGLGEMDPINLYESTLNPAVRRLSRLVITDWDRAFATFNTMMADNQVEARKALISNFKPE
ncbi:MAG: toprim domain-containing protein [Methylophilus sp.]|uniref:toprim domain-containing protein n=1 Tax=Methylophilus sp. TaxID=29541 RepID=UPI003F9F40C4